MKTKTGTPSADGVGPGRGYPPVSLLNGESSGAPPRKFFCLAVVHFGHLFYCYEGRSINKLQNGIIMLICWHLRWGGGDEDESSQHRLIGWNFGDLVGSSYKLQALVSLCASSHELNTRKGLPVIRTVLLSIRAALGHSTGEPWRT